MLLKKEIEELPANWTEYKSELVLNNTDGLKNATSRNLEKQRWILELPQNFQPLLQEMPLGEKPATGGVEVALKTIKNLLNLHRGELREWHGKWETVDAPLPEDSPGMWHEQFFPPHVEDPTAISTVLSKPALDGNVGVRPAVGGNPGDTGGHLVRVAIVIGLADLFFDYGHAQSVRSLYHVWTHLRAFANKRATTKAKSRMTPWQRNAGHW